MTDNEQYLVRASKKYGAQFKKTRPYDTVARLAERDFLAGARAQLSGPLVKEILESYREHQTSKFKSDGSHLQADIRLDQAIQALAAELKRVGRDG